VAKRERIDVLLVQRGLAASRDRAKRLLLAGKVLVDDTPIDKAGAQVRTDAVVRLRGADHPYVSRGGLKLAGALDDFGVEPAGLVCLDVGSSTGGFTDCLLRRGAKQVVAVDVGTNQLHNRLRQDDRVLSLEQTDIRSVELAHLPAPIDLVVVDASFISLRLLLPAIAVLISAGTPVLALVKPQFEVGKDLVGKGGVVRDEALRAQAVDGIASAAEGLGFTVGGRAESHVAGARSGNREVFLMVRLTTQ
jgi:23S rRNA (cytidine1920-2'-O)/16S rRNA (cytidine1409-2'-O)-methyltransferase